MLINISNHPSEKWNERQRKAAEKYGVIIDLLFPQIDPRSSNEEIDQLVDQYYEKVMVYSNPIVMIQGESLFSFRLITKLKKDGIVCLASCSERRTIEYIEDTGFTVRTSEFEFVEFKEY